MLFPKCINLYQIYTNVSIDQIECLKIVTICSTPIIISQLEHIRKSVLQESFEDIRDQSGNPFVTCKLQWKFKLSRREGRLLFRLGSGHCCTNDYRARFNGEGSTCISCSEDETVE